MLHVLYLCYVYRKSPFLKWWPTVVDFSVTSVESAVRTKKPCLTTSATCWRIAVLALVSVFYHGCAFFPLTNSLSFDFFCLIVEMFFLLRHDIIIINFHAHSALQCCFKCSVKKLYGSLILVLLDFRVLLQTPFILMVLPVIAHTPLLPSSASPSMRGSTPLDVAAASVMDNNELALALREPDLEKVRVAFAHTSYTFIFQNISMVQVFFFFSFF